MPSNAGLAPALLYSGGASRSFQRACGVASAGAGPLGRGMEPRRGRRPVAWNGAGARGRAGGPGAAHGRRAGAADAADRAAAQPCRPGELPRRPGRARRPRRDGGRDPRSRRGSRPRAGADRAHGLAGSAGHRHRFHGAAAGRHARARLRRPAGPGRGGRRLRGAAAIPDGRRQPAPGRVRLARSSAQGARIRRPRPARRAHLGCDRVDPLQPAATDGARGMNGWSTLVSPPELAAGLGRPGLVVVDCRFALGDPGAGERAHAESRIPGAVYAHLDRDLSDHRKRGGGQGRHPWPDVADFTARLGAWGIDGDTQVVAYDDANGALAAARFWFLLKALGHELVAVLDGGWSAWLAAGLPVETTPPAPPASTRYDGGFDGGRLLGPAEVQRALDAGDPLLDARAGPRFRGEEEPLDSAAGHVPGARNRPFADNLEHGRFKPAERLAREY